MLKFYALVTLDLFFSYAPIMDDITTYGTSRDRYVTEILCALVCVPVEYLAYDVHGISHS